MAIILTMLLSSLFALLLIAISQISAAVATTTNAAITEYSAGYSHGCDDGKIGFHKYLNTPGDEIDTHTTEFMQAYDSGYKTCFSPNGTVTGSSIKSQSILSSTSSSSANYDTGGTLVSCNRSMHTVEYCNGFRAGAVQSDIDDDPDENITASKVTCKGGIPGSEYCIGYQQGYSDEDHAMFSPPH